MNGSFDPSKLTAAQQDEVINSYNDATRTYDYSKWSKETQDAVIASMEPSMGEKAKEFAWQSVRSPYDIAVGFGKEAYKTPGKAAEGVISGAGNMVFAGGLPALSIPFEAMIIKAKDFLAGRKRDWGSALLVAEKNVNKYWEDLPKASQAVGQIGAFGTSASGGLARGIESAAAPALAKIGPSAARVPAQIATKIAAPSAAVALQQGAESAAQGKTLSESAKEAGLAGAGTALPAPAVMAGGKVIRGAGRAAGWTGRRIFMEGLRGLSPRTIELYRTNPEGVQRAIDSSIEYIASENANLFNGRVSAWLKGLLEARNKELSRGGKVSVSDMGRVFDRAIAKLRQMTPSLERDAAIEDLSARKNNLIANRTSSQGQTMVGEYGNFRMPGKSTSNPFALEEVNAEKTHYQRLGNPAYEQRIKAPSSEIQKNAYKDVAAGFREIVEQKGSRRARAITRKLEEFRKAIDKAGYGLSKGKISDIDEIVDAMTQANPESPEVPTGFLTYKDSVNLLKQFTGKSGDKTRPYLRKIDSILGTDLERNAALYRAAEELRYEGPKVVSSYLTGRSLGAGALGASLGGAAGGPVGAGIGSVIGTTVTSPPMTKPLLTSGFKAAEVGGKYVAPAIKGAERMPWGMYRKKEEQK